MSWLIFFVMRLSTAMPSTLSCLPARFPERQTSDRNIAAFRMPAAAKAYAAYADEKYFVGAIDSAHTDPAIFSNSWLTFLAPSATSS
jgi:hypothetical protein